MINLDKMNILRRLKALLEHSSALSRKQAAIAWLVCSLIWIFDLAYLLLHRQVFSQSEPSRSLFAFLDLFAQLPIQTSFVSEIIAFASAVIALAVPLSTELVSRISERYHSERIIELVDEELSVKLLTPLLLMTILFAILSLFLADYSVDKAIVALLGKFVFLLFVIELVVFYFFLKTLKSYYRNIDNILKRLFSDAESFFK